MTDTSPFLCLTFVLRTFGFRALVDLNILDLDSVFVKSLDIARVRIRQRVDVLEGPQRGVTSPTAFTIFVRDTGDTVDFWCTAMKEAAACSKLNVLPN